MAAAVLGTGDINLHHLKASCKPPGHVTLQGWHQDSFYLKETPTSFVTLIVYLDTTATDAGATALIEVADGTPPVSALLPQSALYGNSVLARHTKYQSRMVASQSYM
jgi:hypothetical protein